MDDLQARLNGLEKRRMEVEERMEDLDEKMCDMNSKSVRQNKAIDSIRQNAAAVLCKMDRGRARRLAKELEEVNSELLRVNAELYKQDAKLDEITAIIRRVNAKRSSLDQDLDRMRHEANQGAGRRAGAKEVDLSRELDWEAHEAGQEPGRRAGAKEDGTDQKAMRKMHAKISKIYEELDLAYSITDASYKKVDGLDRYMFGGDLGKRINRLYRQIR